MLWQVDSLNAGLKPFAAKLSSNALKALEAQRSELLPLFSVRHSHAGKTHQSLNDLAWPFWITIMINTCLTQNQKTWDRNPN
jgi:hypothetical protein